MAGPSDDAYGRVTNPQRYRMVQDAARDVMDELLERFDVQVSAGNDIDPELQRRFASVIVGEMVRFAPNALGAAPLTFAFTSFPAVVVHAGEWRIGAYPRCGCDACDEMPAAVVEELRKDINALTAGAVHERWDGTRLHSDIRYSDGSRSSGWTLIEQDRDRYGPAREYKWQPWPRAQASTSTAI
jgi:Family of unknown function (DUF6226)